MKKLLSIAAFAALLISAAVAPAMATSYPTVYSSYIGLAVPVSCNFIMPAQSFGGISYGLGTTIDADQSITGGACNVKWTASWTDSNATFGPAAGGTTVTGKMKDTNTPVDFLSYTLALPFGGSNTPNTIVAGTMHLHITGGDMQNVIGGQTYSDNLLLTINY